MNSKFKNLDGILRQVVDYMRDIPYFKLNFEVGNLSGKSPMRSCRLCL